MEDVEAIGGQNLAHRLVLKRTDHQISFFYLGILFELLVFCICSKPRGTEDRDVE